MFLMFLGIVVICGLWKLFAEEEPIRFAWELASDMTDFKIKDGEPYV